MNDLQYDASAHSYRFEIIYFEPNAINGGATSFACADVEDAEELLGYFGSLGSCEVVMKVNTLEYPREEWQVFNTVRLFESPEDQVKYDSL